MKGEAIVTGTHENVLYKTLTEMRHTNRNVAIYYYSAAFFAMLLAAALFMAR